MKHKIAGYMLYGLVIATAAVIIGLSSYAFVLVHQAAEVYGSIIGIVFISLGIWMGLKLAKPETVIQQETVIKEVPVAVTAPAGPGRAAALQISPREMEVLRLLARGLSNDEIAGEIFVSPNTVKTHLSSLYFKLDVKRRTQAVEKARSLGLI